MSINLKPLQNTATIKNFKILKQDFNMHFHDLINDLISNNSNGFFNFIEKLLNYYFKNWYLYQTADFLAEHKSRQ